MADSQVATRIQNTLLNNRVKILKLCEYYTVSAPLIAKRILPMEKHKEIKSMTLNIQDSKAGNTARMDSLLDFLDEVPTALAFETFLEGVKNYEPSKQFAKILKKEVEGGNSGIKLPSTKIQPPSVQKVSLGKSPRPTNTTTTISLVPEPTRLQNVTLVPVQNSSGTLFSRSHLGNTNGPTTTTLPLSFTFANPPPQPITTFATTAHAQMLQNLGTDVTRPIKNVLLPALPTTPIPPSVKPKKSTIKKPAQPKKIPATKKSKASKQNGPSTSVVSGDSTPSDVFTFNPNAIPPVPSPKTRTPSALRKANTPKTTAVANKTGGVAGSKKEKDKKPVIKRVYPGKAKAKGATKTVTPGPSLTATLVYKTKEKEAGPSGTSSPKIPGTPTESKDVLKVFNTSVPPGSPFRPKNGVSKAHQHAKPMTFEEADEKQRTGSTRSNGFTFVNSQAKVKKINYNDKSDLFYEGCPTKEGNYLCTRKVQLKGKGKKYVCKQKHENEAYELFPRLYVTFEDDSGQMETALFRENVEILSGKSISEMHTMNDAALSTEFSKAVGVNIPVRITAEKVLKKDLKVCGGRLWNNIAHILNDNSSGPPPVKKSKKGE